MPDETIVNRVQALLAKAESSTFAAEREVFYAKAQSLMAREMIDQAMLDAHEGRRTDQITSRMVDLPAPYGVERGFLLGAVAQANGVRGWIDNGRDKHFMLVGFESDLVNTCTLFASLSLHAVGDMLAIPTGRYPVRERKSFMLGFATRIESRLTAANKAACREYEAETGQSTTLVLRERDQEVAEFYDTLAAGEGLRTIARSVGSGAGFAAGTSSADRAGLGHRAVSGRAALGSG